MTKSIRSILEENTCCGDHNDIDQALADIKTAFEGEAVEYYDEFNSKLVKAIPLDKLNEILGGEDEKTLR